MRRQAWLAVGLMALVGAAVRPVVAEPLIERLVQLPVGDAAHGLAVGPDGLLYVSDTGGGRTGLIFVFSNSGQLSGRIVIPAGPSGIIALRGLVFDQQGSLYVADMANGQPERGRIIRVNSRGRQNIFASGLTAPGGLAIDQSDVLYVTDGLNGSVLWIGPDGASAPFVEDERLRPHSQAGFGATGLAFAPNGRSLYVSNTADNRLLRIGVDSDGAAGRVSVLAEGSGPPASGRRLDGPEGLAVDSGGNILVAASRSDHVEAFDPEGKPLWQIPAGGRSVFATPTSLAVWGRSLFVANLAENGLSFVSRIWLYDLD